MSCTGRHFAMLFAPMLGMSAEQLAMALDSARRRPILPLDIDPAIIDAVARHAPVRNPDDLATMLRLLGHVVGTSVLTYRDPLRQMRYIALIRLLTAAPLPNHPPAPPDLVERLRADLCHPPIPRPLPVEMPSDPAEIRSAVHAACRLHGMLRRRDIAQLSQTPQGGCMGHHHGFG